MKRFVMLATLMLLIGCMSALAQTRTQIYFEGNSATDTTGLFTSSQGNTLLVIWYLSDGTTKTVEMPINEIKSGDMLDIVFPGTSVESALVTSTYISLEIYGRVEPIQKTFTGFVDLVTCRIHYDVDDLWILW